MTRHTLARHLGAAMGATLVASLVALVLVAQTPQPEALLGAALHLEEVEGDLEAAIAGYERVIAHAAVDRATAGRAWLRIGVCYEKLGRPEASAAYERVISEFADRPEAAEALFRVRAFGAAEAVSMPGQDLVARQILQSYQMGGPSRDGRFFTVNDWDAGHLEVRDLRTGASRRVTDGYPQIVQESIVSPDGETIAYSVFPGGNDNELRIVNRDGSGERVVLADPDVAYVRPEAWSRDGASVLAVVYRTAGGTSLALIAVADGRMTVVRATQPGEGVPNADLSPDGRHVVFDRISDADSEARDVVVVPTTGGREQLIAGSAADDRQPIWSPDGSSVLFLSNRGGEYDLWAQPVAGGSPQGAPRLVRGGIGNVELRGLTEDGSLYYGSFTQFYDVRLARYDSDSGRLTALPTGEQLETRPGLNRFPWWSPDGRRIAYVHRAPGSSARRHSLVVQTVAAGEQREFELGRWQLARVRGWSADGTRVLIVAWGDNVEQVSQGIYWLHAGSGEVELIARQGAFAGARLSPRGDTIYVPRRSGIAAYDLQSGQMHAVGPSQGAGAMPFSFAVSPDGRLLAFQAADEFLGGGVMVMDPAGGQARELYRPGSMLHGLTFTPDGRHLLALSDTDDDEAYAVWRIPVDGGPAQETGLVVNVDNKLSGLTFHPDGRTFTYVDGHSRGEVWMLERLMADAPGR